MAKNNRTSTDSVVATDLANGVLTSVVSGDVSKGARYIADHPREFGFNWEYAAVSGSLTEGGEKVLLRKNAPKIFFTAELLPLFVATFGYTFLAKGMNGTSTVVSCQRIARDSIIADSGITNETLQERMVSSILLGVIVRGGGSTRTFVALDGSEHKTSEAAQAHNKAQAPNDTEKQAAFLAAAVDRGMSYDAAKEMWNQFHAG